MVAREVTSWVGSITLCSGDVDSDGSPVTVLIGDHGEPGRVAVVGDGSARKYLANVRWSATCFIVGRTGACTGSVDVGARLAATQPRQGLVLGVRPMARRCGLRSRSPGCDS